MDKKTISKMASSILIHNQCSSVIGLCNREDFSILEAGSCKPEEPAKPLHP
jgi:hypothetical protein